MYPTKKQKEYPPHILKNVWDEPPTNPAKENGRSNNFNEINLGLNENEILKFLYEYVSTHFNQFEHNVSIGDRFEKWWQNHKFGTSYQPIVQCCFIRKGLELGLDVREHHSQKRITELALEVHGVKYDRETKVKSYKNIDVCWGENDTSFDSNNLILALEYEDSGKIDELFEELYQNQKLIALNSKFTVLGTRLNSVSNLNYTVDNIQKRLSEYNIDRFFENRLLIFIFIAPDSTTNPSKIGFYGYVLQNSELERFDNDEYSFNIISKKTPDKIIMEQKKHDRRNTTGTRK